MNYTQVQQKNTPQSSQGDDTNEVLVFTNKKTMQRTCYNLKSIFPSSNVQDQPLNQDFLIHLKNTYNISQNEIKTTPSSAGSLCQEVLKAIRGQNTIALFTNCDYEAPIAMSLKPENLLIWPNYFFNIITTLHPQLSQHEMKKVLLFKTITKELLVAQWYQDNKTVLSPLNTQMQHMLEEQKKKQVITFFYSLCAPEKQGYNTHDKVLSGVSPYSLTKSDELKVDSFFDRSKTKIKDALRFMNASQLYSLVLDASIFSSQQSIESSKNSIAQLCGDFLSSNHYPVSNPKLVADFIDKYLNINEEYWKKPLDETIESQKILNLSTQAFLSALTPQVLNEAFNIYLKKYKLNTLSLISDLGVLHNFGFSDFLLKNITSHIPPNPPLPSYRLSSIFTLLLNCSLKPPLSSLSLLNSLLQDAAVYFPGEAHLSNFKAIQTLNLNFSRTQLLKELVQKNVDSCATSEQISDALKNLQQLMSMVHLASEVFNNEKVGQSISTPQNLNSKFYIFLCEQQMIVEKKLLSSSIRTSLEISKVMKI